MANELGKRMAAICLNDGKELSIRNFLLYSEWDNSNADNIYKPNSYVPCFSLNVIKCCWKSAWRKHNMLHISNDYCLEIDKQLMYGFSPEINFQVSGFLTEGKKYCDFKWLEKIFNNEEEYKEFLKERNSLTDKVTEDFLYHSAHLYSCAKKVLYEVLEQAEADKILATALVQYKKKFSTKKCDLLLLNSTNNFSIVKKF